MKQLVYLIIVMIVMTACSGGSGVSDERSAELMAEVDSITDDRSLKEYLLEIVGRDQRYRTQERSVLANFGYGSEQHLELQKNMEQVDAENRVSVKYFLEKFDYPEKSIVGRRAVVAPAVVIHHSGDFDDLKNNFPVFFQAYEDGNIESELMCLYLERAYHFQEGHGLDWEGPFRYSQKIDSLITLLDFDKLLESH